METKVCNKCNKDLPIEMFYRSKRNKGGRRNECKKCQDEYKRQYYNEHKEEIEKRQEQYKEKGVKICTKCSRELPATSEFFQKSRTTKSGITSICKKCSNERLKEYWKNNKDKARDHEKNRKNKKERAEKCKEYYKKNREKMIEQSRQRYYKNKDEILQKQKKSAKLYREKNKEKIRNKTNLYRCRKRNLPHSLTTEQWEEIKIYFHDKCAYCGKELLLTQEHFIPINKGGEYSKNNIIPACKKCNCSKKDTDFFQWYPRQKCYSEERKKKILEFLKLN